MAMDLITSPAVPLGVVPPSAQTPDSDTETPPPPPQPPSQPHPKKMHHSALHAPPGDAVVSYKECLKNHAASIGGHALDGCCEFMPGPTASPSDPTSLKCAACGCHRNFHRRDPDDPSPLHHHLPTARRDHSPPSASHLLLSLSGQSPSRPSEEINPASGWPGMMGSYHYTTTTNGGQNGNSQSHSSKKRFRTKFRQEQKEKMYEFSERIGWRLRKGEEKLVEDFCKQVGVGRGVFKVWMHNNKHSSSSLKKEQQKESSSNTNTSNININSSSNNHHKLHDLLVNSSTNRHSNGGSSSNNGNCGSGNVVVREFYGNGAHQQQETR